MKKHSYYLLGIGGVSMSALAVMLKEKGCCVGGCDEVESHATDILRQNGIEVDFVLNEEKLKTADIVVSSSAIKTDNPWWHLTKKLEKKVLIRGELLGEISDEYEKVIAVAGSHGKTTTTALINQILEVAGLKPTLHLGGFKVDDGLNFHLGDKQFFVTEACEYYNNFLHLHPYIGVVTNMEKEHMDFFKSFANQKKSFEKFKAQSRFVIENTAGLVAKNVQHDSQGGLVFSIYEKNKKLMDLHMHICEEVNTQNCLYAFLVAKKLGLSDCVIKAGLESFQGVKTRFEKMKCTHFDTVICDYAHHPTEISKAILTAEKLFKDKKLIVIFQPHTFSRTKTLLPQFLSVFERLKNPVIFKTYSAREKPEDGISGQQLAEILKEQNQNAQYFDNFETLDTFLKQFSKIDTALLFVGAGDLPTILHKKNFLE